MMSCYRISASRADTPAAVPVLEILQLGREPYEVKD